MTLLILYLLLAIGVSFLCSMLEAGLLSVPEAHVALLVERGKRSGHMLERMKSNIDRPLSAILTLNTIAHTVGAAGVGAQAAVVFGKAWVGLTSAVLTLLILVLSEIIPKTLGAVYAKPLTGFTAVATRGLMIGLYPVVVALEGINRLIGGNRQQARLDRSELRSIADLGRQEGAVSHSEASMIRNLLALREIPVRQIMTPRSVMFAMPEDQTVDQAVDPRNPLRFARIPIHSGDLDHLTGLVTRYHIHEAYRNGRTDAPLKELARPIHPVPEHASIADVTEQFLQQDTQLFQVVDEYGGTAGIVTLEDAMETLLGTEIVDETDAVVDMQALARQMLRRRPRMRPLDHRDAAE